jgi:hypothetical protein
MTDEQAPLTNLDVLLKNLLCSSTLSRLNVRKLLPCDDFTECGLSETDSDLHVLRPQGDMKRSLQNINEVSVALKHGGILVNNATESDLHCVSVHCNFEVLVTLTWESTQAESVLTHIL